MVMDEIVLREEGGPKTRPGSTKGWSGSDDWERGSCPCEGVSCVGRRSAGLEEGIRPALPRRWTSIMEFSCACSWGTGWGASRRRTRADFTGGALGCVTGGVLELVFKVGRPG